MSPMVDEVYSVRMGSFECGKKCIVKVLMPFQPVHRVVKEMGMINATVDLKSSDQAITRVSSCLADDLWHEERPID